MPHLERNGRHTVFLRRSYFGLTSRQRMCSPAPKFIYLYICIHTHPHTILRTSIIAVRKLLREFFTKINAVQRNTLYMNTIHNKTNFYTFIWCSLNLKYQNIKRILASLKVFIFFNVYLYFYSQYEKYIFKWTKTNSSPESIVTPLYLVFPHWIFSPPQVWKKNFFWCCLATQFRSANVVLA